MNVQHSIGMPVRCEIRRSGRMSAISVRAAQLARDPQTLVGDLAREPFDVLHDVRPAPGRPMSAVSMPRRS